MHPYFGVLVTILPLCLELFFIYIFSLRVCLPPSPPSLNFLLQCITSTSSFLLVLTVLTVLLNVPTEQTFVSLSCGVEARDLPSKNQVSSRESQKSPHDLAPAGDCQGSM